MARKDVYISELLDRLAIVECEVKGKCTERLSIWAARLRAAGFAVISQYFILAPAWRVFFCCEVWKISNLPEALTEHKSHSELALKNRIYIK